MEFYYTCQRCGKHPPLTDRGQYCYDCLKQSKQGRTIIFKATGEYIPDPPKPKKEKKKKRTGCPGCIYYRRIAYKNPMKCCHYTLDTGEIRPMKADECYKYEGTCYTPIERKKSIKHDI